MVLYNTEPLPLGSSPSKAGDFDRPGWYTYNRGATVIGRGRWGYGENGWKEVLIPNRVLRTYQGYGFDDSECPDSDPNLSLTGTWLIDEVDMTSPNNTITLTCRDFAKILLEEIVFPPVIPLAQYPLAWESYHTTSGAPSSKWTELRLRWDDDSNTPWYGRGSVLYGHKGSHAFDERAASYWLSVGNADPVADYAFEWVQGRVPNTDIQGVRFTPWAGNYVVYVSVYANGAWQGSDYIPYNPFAAPAAPNHANIKYVKQTTCGWEAEQSIDLGRVYHHVTKLRLTFHRLAYNPHAPYHYRAGVRSFVALRHAKATPRKVGNYGDYTDIVKYFCGVGGFYWPPQAFRRTCDGEGHTFSYTRSDPVVGVGRIWGDFELTRTSGPIKIPHSQFDKQPLMSAIQYVRDIVGYTFFIDEAGGAVFRAPNIWSVGNYVRPDSHTAARTKYVPTLDEKVTIRELSAKLSDREFRRRTFVANLGGNKAALARLTSELANEMDIGIERVDIISDQHFETKAECQKMADLVQLRRLFTYRRDSITITGNPYLQPDDQVRIIERVTGETYVHRIVSISSAWDNDQGEYTMNLETHWLGEHPFNKWAFSWKQMAKETQQYFRYLKKVRQ